MYKLSPPSHALTLQYDPGPPSSVQSYPGGYHGKFLVHRISFLSLSFSSPDLHFWRSAQLHLVPKVHLDGKGRRTLFGDSWIVWNFVPCGFARLLAAPSPGTFSRFLWLCPVKMLRVFRTSHPFPLTFRSPSILKKVRPTESPASVIFARQLRQFACRDPALKDPRCDRDLVH